jgi:antitoxin component YwqK of YwqJK toxin-antitoxin module
MKQLRLKLFSFLIVWFLPLDTWAQDINKNDANGKKHGLWKGYYEGSKRPRYEGTFEHGVETGTFNYFDDTKANGIIATRTFSNNGTEAYTVLYDRVKNIVSEGKNVNKLKEGKWIVYHEGSKQPMSIENYVNGKLHGNRKVYFKDGALAEEANFENGLLHGPYKKFTEKGEVLEETNYVKGSYHGPAIFRDGDGKLASKGNFEDGMKKGEWEFYVKGKLSKKETYPMTTIAGKKGKPKNK